MNHLTNDDNDNDLNTSSAFPASYYRESKLLNDQTVLGPTSSWTIPSSDRIKFMLFLYGAAQKINWGV